MAAAGAAARQADETGAGYEHKSQWQRLSSLFCPWRNFRATLAFLSLRGFLQFTSTWMLFIVPKLSVFHGQQYEVQAFVGLWKIVGAVAAMRLVSGRGRKRSLVGTSSTYAVALCLVAVGAALSPKDHSAALPFSGGGNTTNATGLMMPSSASSPSPSSVSPSPVMMLPASSSPWLWLATAVGLSIGNILLAILYALSQLLVVESYPTAVRSTALGLCMIVQRCSSMVASFAAEGETEGDMERGALLAALAGVALWITACAMPIRGRPIEG
jgi:hypothetical protein